MKFKTWSKYVAVLCFAVAVQAAAADRIEPYSKNPRYWQYKGKPVLLLGGSVEDNLFQIPNLREHLDLLKSSGGNYVRCTMSSRDPGDVWPFAPDPATGRYDLNRLNDEYWRRFESLLKLGLERDVIVQIELWDRFDFAREPWEANPFNPKNNINYTAAGSGLPEIIEGHPQKRENGFFRSLPGLENNALILKYQHALVDRLLTISLRYPNVLYCMDNETNESPLWGAYWARYIRDKAAKAGVSVHTTEMWDPWDLSDPMHNHTFDHPEIYSFIDISQNNHQKGQAHWDNAQKQRARIAEDPRPLNNVKIYGADTGRYGTDRDGIERFWRNVFGGMASARFHRPASGLGLGEKAQANLKSMRSLTDRMDIFSCEPRNNLLTDREPNEAFLIAEPGRQYAVYFPDGGEVRLDLSQAKGKFQARWLDILETRWGREQALVGGGLVSLRAPGQGHWAVLIVAGSGR